MSADIYDWGMNKSTMTYDGWVIKLRQVCLVRLKQVRHIRGSDCSSWPTVLGVDAKVGAVISKDDKFKMTKTGRLAKDQPQRQRRIIGAGSYCEDVEGCEEFICQWGKPEGSAKRQSQETTRNRSDELANSTSTGTRKHLCRLRRNMSKSRCH